MVDTDGVRLEQNHATSVSLRLVTTNWGRNQGIEFRAQLARLPPLLLGIFIYFPVIYVKSL